MSSPGRQSPAAKVVDDFPVATSDPSRDGRWGELFSHGLKGDVSLRDRPGSGAVSCEEVRRDGHNRGNQNVDGQRAIVPILSIWA
jgi:hypothetical protein